MKPHKNPMAVALLEELLLVNQPRTAIELGLATRRISPKPNASPGERRRMEMQRIRGALRYLQEYGLIERMPVCRRPAHGGRPAYLYQPTTDGKIWLDYATRNR